MKRLLTALLLSAAALAAAAGEPAPAATQPAATEPAATQAPESAAPDRRLTSSALQVMNERMDAYDQFRALFEAAQFAEALPLAQRVVELSEAAGSRENELPIAYNNLAATQYQLSDYAGAEFNYKKSLALLEANQGISSRRLIVPLTGLGAVYAALDQHPLAVQQFDRALAVSRRSEGLFNLSQLPLIEQAAASRYAVGDYVGVERDRLYALRISEQHYGFDDPHTIPAAMELASFYESVKQFTAARGLYLHMRDISLKEHAGYSPTAVKSLLGIGRTHRLQYTMEPEAVESQQPSRDGVSAEIGSVYRESRVSAADRTGLAAIEKALELVRAAPDAPRPLLAETLTELGDWYQATARASTATPFYAEASSIYSAEADSGTGNPLSAPRMIFYRPPIASTRGAGIATDDVVIREAQFSFDVNEFGYTRNVAVVTTDMADGQLAQSRRSMEHAVYSPRFENGKPVATQGVQFTSRWYELRKVEKPSTSG